MYSKYTTHNAWFPCIATIPLNTKTSSQMSRFPNFSTQLLQIRETTNLDVGAGFKMKWGQQSSLTVRGKFSFSKVFNSKTVHTHSALKQPIQGKVSHVIIHFSYFTKNNVAWDFSFSSWHTLLHFVPMTTAWSEIHCEAKTLFTSPREYSFSSNKYGILLFEKDSLSCLPHWAFRDPRLRCWRYCTTEFGGVGHFGCNLTNLFHCFLSIVKVYTHQK